jgi:uncharacterized protein involved in exopolysaccharide biosynthesis
MKFMLVSFMLFLSCSALAEIKNGYLTAEDQKYYKNESFDGNNQRERIDSTVKEINKLMGEMATMKEQIQTLRAEVDELKKAK